MTELNASMNETRYASVSSRRCVILWGFALGLGGWFSLLMGCGYTLVGTLPATTEAPLSIAIPAVANLTREPDLERRMTAALRQAVAQAPTLVLASEHQASHTLEGVARQFQAFATSLDAGDNVVQFRVESSTRIRLLPRQSDQPIIEQDISAWTEYLVSPTGSVRENAAARAAAITRVAKQFAEKCRALVEITLM